MKYLDAKESQQAKGNAPREYLTASVSISAARMLTLDANPVVVVPAPGPGKLLVPLTLFARGQGGTPYDQSNGNLALRYESGVEALQLLDSVGGADAPFSYMGPAMNGFATPIENDAIVLATDVPGSGELTAGDYGFELRLEYQIVDV